MDPGRPGGGRRWCGAMGLASAGQGDVVQVAEVLGLLSGLGWRPGAGVRGQRLALLRAVGADGVAGAGCRRAANC